MAEWQMSEWLTPQQALDARRKWRQMLGYSAAEVAICHMNMQLARETLGDEMVDVIVADALFAFMGNASDWNLDG